MPYDGDILELSDAKMLRIIEEDWNASEQHYQTIFEDTKRRMMLFHLKLYDYGISQRDLREAEPEAGTSAAIFVPLARPVCETALSSIMGTIAPANVRWLMGEAASEVVGAEEAHIATEFMSLRLKQMHYLATLERAILQALQKPWSACICEWKMRDGNVPSTLLSRLHSVMKNLGEADLPQVVGEIKKSLEAGDFYEWKYNKIDRSDFRVLDTFDTRPDWRYPDIRDSAFFGYESFSSWEELEKMEALSLLPTESKEKRRVNVSKMRKQYQILMGKRAKNRKNLKTDEFDELRLNGAPLKSEEFEADLKGLSITSEGYEDERVKVRTYHTPTAKIRTDASFKYILSAEPMDCIPVVCETYATRGTSFDSESVLELLEPLNRQVNYMVNMRLENQDRIIRQLLIINKKMLAPGQGEINIDQSSIIEVTGPVNEAVKQISSQLATNEYSQDIQFLLELVARVTGLDANIQGLYYRGGSKTATESDIVRDAVMTRLGRLIKRFESSFVQDAVEKLYVLEDQFMDYEVPVKVLGPDGDYYPRMNREVFSLIGGNIYWIPKGSIYWQSKREQVAAIERMIGMWSGIADVKSKIDWGKLFKMHAELLGIHDVDEVILDEEDYYKIPPELEHELMAFGSSDLEPGAFDNDDEHIQAHTELVENVKAGRVPQKKFPKHRIAIIEKHISKHFAKQQAAQTSNMSGAGGGEMLPTGQTQLPGDTSGSQTAQLNNPQTGGPPPPKNATGQGGGLPV